ncbi:hypothetical protein [Agathobacter sp.]|uniref:hypothetical protein n=1 Tax=Agathobacter sp. TaxID=2021311 RepID=UPI003FD7B5E0
MRKYFKRKLTSVLLAITMLITMLPVAVKAADDGIYGISHGNVLMNVDNQGITYSNYIAYINHSFDCSFGGDYYPDADFKVTFDDKDFTEYVTADSDNISMSIPQDVIAKYEAGKSYEIVYGYYKDDEPFSISTSWIEIKNPHFLYTPYYKDRQCLVGSNYIWESGLESLGDSMVYDWEHPYGDSSDSVKATSVEIVNNPDTPDAFINEGSGDKVAIKANKLGSATINTYYSKLDGYTDDNPKGYYSAECTATEEVVSISITSTLGRDTAMAGDTFDLKAQARSSIILDTLGTSEQETERNITYNWFGGVSSNSGFSYEVDKKDSSICHIKVSDVSVDETVDMYLTYSYIDSEGNVQSNSSTENYAPISYGVNLASSYYRIDCDIPEKIDVGETVNVRPVLKKVTASGESEVPNAQFYISWYSGGLNINNNSDGTLSITRNFAGDTEFCLEEYETGSSRVFNILDKSSGYQCISFSNSSVKYDGSNDVKLCLNTSGLTADYDKISLYMTENNGKTDIIDPSYYSTRKLDNVIYYTISSKWFEVNSDRQYYNIEAVASNNGKEIASTVATIDYANIYGGDPFQLYGDKLIVNNRMSMFGSSVYTIDGRGYDCVLDSIKENGNSILTINKKDGFWEYYANKSGTTNIVCYYHYYKNGKRIDATTNSKIIAEKYETGFSLEVEGSDEHNVFVGDTLYYYISSYKQSYDSNGYSKKEELEKPYRAEFDVSLFDDEGVKLTKTVLSDSRIKIDIDSDSREGGAWISAEIYDSNNQHVGSSGTGLSVHNKPYYREYLDETYYNDEEPWNVTVMPRVYEYSKDNRDGKDISSEYNVSYSVEKDAITRVTKNSDGSYTMCNYSDKRAESNYILFTLTPKESGKREALSMGYMLNDTGEDWDLTQEVKKEQSLSLIDSDTLGLNIYWSTKGIYGYGVKAKVSIEGEPYNVWYVDLTRDNDKSSDDGYEHFKSTIKLDSGQMAKNIKVQLVYSGGGTALDEFTTSVASYAKKIIDSNDSTYAKYKPLLKAMLNYGAASQNYFNYDTGKLANSCLSASDKNISGILQNDIDRYNINKKFHIKGLSYYGTSLVLGDQILMRHYFKLENGRDISNYSACIYKKDNTDEYTKNGSYLEFKKVGDMYYIDTALNEKSIFGRPDIEISDGADYECFLYSPMNYVAKAYTKGNMDPKLKNLLNAMYWMEKEKSKLG